MNERIKELAEQADEYANSLYSIHGESMKGQYQDVALAKFAELIIQECAEVASSYDGAHYVGTAIKQHFGVEK